MENRERYLKLLELKYNAAFYLMLFGNVTFYQGDLQLFTSTTEEKVNSILDDMYEADNINGLRMESE